MNRRGFLKWFGGAAVAATAALALPDQEIWTNSRTIFLPPAGGWAGGNSLLTIQQITEEALRVLHEKMQFRTARQYVINNDSLPVKVEMAYRWTARDHRLGVDRLNRMIEGWGS